MLETCKYIFYTLYVTIQEFPVSTKQMITRCLHYNDSTYAMSSEMRSVGQPDYTLRYYISGGDGDIKQTCRYIGKRKSVKWGLPMTYRRGSVKKNGTLLSEIILVTSFTKN
jgi:hypothetical protein